MKLHNVRDEWTSPASEAVIEHVAERLRERNIEVTIVDDGDAAREAALTLIPAGAEVHSAKSKTLQDTGFSMRCTKRGASMHSGHDTSK